MTKVVKNEYEKQMLGCEGNGIIRRDGFLYLEGVTNYQLRVPGDTGEKREIGYISREELGSGMLEIVRQNVFINFIWKLDDALNVVRDCIKVNGDRISPRDN